MMNETRQTPCDTHYLLIPRINTQGHANRHYLQTRIQRNICIEAATTQTWLDAFKSQ